MSSWRLFPTDYWAYWEDGFSTAECKKIIELGESKTLSRGTVIGGKEVRESDIVFIHPDDDSIWLFQKITGIVNAINDKFFRFDLTGMVEGLQFTKYEAPGGYYGKHVDAAGTVPVRKLSFTLQLSDPNEYEGGDLCLYFNDEPIRVNRKQGFVAVFPSWALHEVEPVTKGTRYSLVVWITGAAFR